MRYPALIDVDGDRVVAEFPDCPGCASAVGPEQDIVAAATVALRRWLESCLVDGTVPPKPSVAVVTRDWFEWIEIPPDLASKLLLRWAAAKRISRSELARRAGISEEALAALEDQTVEPSRAALDGVSRALGVLASSRPTRPRDGNRKPPAAGATRARSKKQPRPARRH